MSFLILILVFTSHPVFGFSESADRKRLEFCEAVLASLYHLDFIESKKTSVMVVRQIRDTPYFQYDARQRDHIAHLQYRIARFILKLQNPAVFDDEISQDVFNPTTHRFILSFSKMKKSEFDRFLSRVGETSLRHIFSDCYTLLREFPNGLPQSFSSFSAHQRFLLANLGAPLLLWVFGDIPTLYKTISAKEKSGLELQFAKIKSKRGAAARQELENLRALKEKRATEIIEKFVDSSRKKDQTVVLIFNAGDSL